jgi:rubrerythrin
MLEDITLAKCVEFAIATEESGEKFYQAMADKFSDNREISDLFSRLALDERVHKQQFSKYLKEIPGADPAPLRDESFEYLKAMSISEFFSTGKGPFKDVEKVKDRDEALSHAFEMEKATLGYYNAMKDVIGENDVLDSIIRAEQDHVASIMKVMITGGKFRSLQDKY